ncbi:MAG: S46 family peptidase [Marinilabiliaceae bacterium]|nr:S46 family peptidase [Marinilabiliaceae bacterium]
MKQIKILLLLSLMIVCNTKADEGMWLLPLIEKLNIEKMNEMGLKLTAEDIFSTTQPSVSDAIVIFGRGCTAEFISDKGLILTNHHCGFDVIQSLSSMENNYLVDGFWAFSFDEEIPAPGLTISLLKRMENVTETILEGIGDDADYDERQKIISERRTQLEKEAKEESQRAMVYEFFAGNQYYLVVYDVFKDVRFVGAPPSSIGKFGYDTDNWMWPRHTCDFSLFRVYADKDGNPAEYSENNVPFKPPHHLPISLKGYEIGDFAMTIGYPGRTDRYLTSFGIEERVNINNHWIIKIRGIKQDIWADAMNKSDKVRLQYSSKYSNSSNYWKNSIGMNKGIAALDVVSKKQAIEKEFSEWSKQNPKFENVMTSLKSGYENRAEILKASLIIRETLFNGTEILRFAMNAEALEVALQDKDANKIEKATEKLKEEAETFFKDYHAPTDEKVFLAMIELYSKELPRNLLPSFLQEIEQKNSFKVYTQNLFSKSIFTDEKRFNNFLAKPNLKTLQSDPAYKAALSSAEMINEIFEKNIEFGKILSTANRLFIEGLMTMSPNTTFYPDANSTLRLSYGTVGDYEPRDAVIYKHFTTLTGVMEKEDPFDNDFIVPQKLKDLYKTKDWGQYGASDGQMYVNYTTNNDITGGNSGSPVINGNGELVGLAFDGNWEAMSGDIAFEELLQKCINVDIRYVLFIIDKFAGAKNLIEEMSFVD